MKKISLVLVIIFILTAFVYASVFVFINTRGKDLLINTIEDNWGTKAEVSDFSFKFPFNLEIKNFSCGDLRIQKADIFLLGFNPFSSGLAFNRVSLEGVIIQGSIKKDGFYIDPVIKGKLPFKTARVSYSSEFGFIPSAFASLEDNRQPSYIKIHKLSIKNSRIELVDLRQENPVKFSLEDINVELRNFIYPQLPKFILRLRASLDTESIKMDDFVSIDGWIDYSSKDMDVELKLKNIDYSAFAVYYPKNWKPDKIGVKKAILSLDAGFNSRNNDLVVDCTMFIDKIDYMEEDKIENPSRMKFLKTALVFLKGKADKPHLSVQFKTKMDSPSLDLSVVKDELKTKLRYKLVGAVIGQALDKTQDIIKDTKEITVDTAIDTFKEIGDKFKNKFKDIFDSSDKDEESADDSN
jgi:hypothetical protein